MVLRGNSQCIKAVMSLRINNVDGDNGGLSPSLFCFHRLPLNDTCSLTKHTMLTICHVFHKKQCCYFVMFIVPGMNYCMYSTGIYCMHYLNVLLHVAAGRGQT